MSSRTIRLPVVKFDPGRKRFSRSWLRRSISSISGGRIPPPPPGVGPRFHGPFDPGPPDPLPSDELFQGMLESPLPWFPKVRRLYEQRRRGANLAAPSKRWHGGLSVQGLFRVKFAYGSRDTRRGSEG